MNLTLRNHIVVSLQLTPMTIEGEIPCLPTDSYVFLKFKDYVSVFSGKCYFIDKEKCCAGEAAVAKIVMVYFDLLKDYMKPSMPFILQNNGSLEIGTGIINEIIGLE
jgi:hypothetical protein